jgi:flagellar basal body P-ring formation protein FlgA
MTLTRLLPLILAGLAAAAPALAQGAPRQSQRLATALPEAVTAPVLKADVTVTAEIITFGDLLAGLPSDAAKLPAFRAPALGDTGTIQLQRVREAARMHSLPEFEAGPVAQVVVTRAARRISAGEIEIAIRQALEERFGVDARDMQVQFEGGMPQIAVEAGMTVPVSATDISYDPRLKRVVASIAVPGSAAMRLKPLRVAGQLVETVEVIVPLRAIGRGEPVASADVTIERRPRDQIQGDYAPDLGSAVGKVARRPLIAGQPIRVADVQRQEVIARGDLVTMTFEAKGLALSMRAKAIDAGAAGDVIQIQNPQSKRVIQATVMGPGRVSVTPGALAAGRVVAAAGAANDGVNR